MAAINVDEKKLGEQLKGTKPVSKEMVDNYEKLVDEEEKAVKEVYAKLVKISGGNPLIENHINSMNNMYQRLRDGIKLFRNPGLIKEVNKEE